VTEVEVLTASVVTPNATLEDPAGMDTLAGTVATAVLLLSRAIVAPPLGASPFNVKVPVEGDPPLTLDGFSVSELSEAGGITAREAMRVTPESDADSVTEVEVVTARVDTVKVALIAPAGMVTLAGTVAAAVLLLTREMTAPPLGAAPLRVTLPIEGDPPVTLVGFSVNVVSVGPEDGGVTVRAAVRVTPEYDAESVTEVEEVTASVDTWKVALLAPDGTVTVAGTVATAVLLLERDTSAPPVGAGALSVTVPVEGEPPFTLVGFRATEDNVAGPDVTVVMALQE